jgi:cellobiose phosphorylase
MPTMKFGHFTRDGREFVITDPRTPRPWHNYLVNDEYLVNLTQHATGASFWQPKGEGLRTNLTEDRDGSGGPRFVYLRDNESGRCWSLTGAPAHPRLARWECRVGLGYQINRSRHQGLDASWRPFGDGGTHTVRVRCARQVNHV